MAHVAVTLEFNHTSKDLALPIDVTVRLVIESLVEALHLKKKPGQRYALSIKTEQGVRLIPPNATLAEANVLHGTVLLLFAEEHKADEHLSGTGAYLQAENGRTFPITKRETVVGRNDPKSGNFVDVDLNGLVTDSKIISRRHATIELDADRFYLVDLKSTNGTSVNGQRIRPKEKHPLSDGDKIEFAHNGVQMTFVSAKKNEKS